MEGNLNKDTLESQSFNPVDDFNPGLLIYVIKKSVLWLIFIVLVSVTLSIIYLRYSPRIYQASTTLMLKTEKTAQILGVENIVTEQDQSEIRREIQLIKSKLLIESTINELPLQVGYYKEGKTKLVYSELYSSSPFEVKGTLKRSDIVNVPIYVKLLNTKKMYINFNINGRDYEYRRDTGQTISNAFFSLSIHTKPYLDKKDFSGIYFFKFLSKQDLIQEISSKLEVLPLDNKTQTIRLIYNDRNPIRAAAIVSTTAQEFIKFDVNRKREGIISILTFIQNQIDTFGAENDQYQDSIAELQLKEGYVDKGKDYIDGLSAKLMDYEAMFLDYDYDISLLKAFKETIRTSKEYSSLPDIKFRTINQTFDQEISVINKLQSDRNMLLLDATEQHPNVRFLDVQMSNAKLRLSNNIDHAIDNVSSNKLLLEKEYYKYMDEIKNFPALQNRFGRFGKMAEEKNKFILNLYSQMSSYLIASAGIVSDYVILEKAIVPSTPVSPKENLVHIAGFVIGLLICLVFVAVRYFLQNTIISIDDVERKTKAPLLGVIPRFKEELERSQIVVTQDPKSTITEAFRAIRGNLQFISNVQGPKVISTTSTVPGEGKTFVSLNLAAILSLLNKKVIILDFDMRKPRLDKIFEVQNYKGVSSILSGQSQVDDCVLDTGIPNLHFITSGPVPPNPSELILLPKLQETIDYLKSTYDYVILDTPPIGLVTDALEILKISDYPIYVLRAAYSQKGFIHGINKIITESKIRNLSIVINDFGRGASGYGTKYGTNYGYGYGYGYGYSYGYGSEYEEGYYTTDASTKTSLLKRLFGD